MRRGTRAASSVPRLVAGIAAVALALAACGSGAVATPVASVPPSAAATASPEPSLAPTPAPTPVPSVAAAACAAASLAARVTHWDAGAGQRAATVSLTNTGSPCSLAVLARPQLVDGKGNVLIDGKAPAAGTPTLTLAAGGVVSTMVQVGNYCGAAPVAPVSVAFVIDGGAGRVVAQPVSATDTDGLPPCLGDPGSAGTIEMKDWAP